MATGINFIYVTNAVKSSAMSITGKLNINVKRLKMIKTTTKQTKQILEDQRDEQELLYLLKRDLRFKIQRHCDSFSFKAYSDFKMFGTPLIELYYIKRYDAHDDIFLVNKTLSLTNRVTELRMTENELIEITNKMVL
jgi:hypothetical protein